MQPSEKEKSVTSRSDFLIHWTGKDIHRDYITLCDIQREKYLDRLRGTLCGGLWMMKIPEKFKLDAGPELRYEIPATCFTEIKLSDTYEHTKHYGCLGFGFNRSFVLSQWGQPVQYVVSKNSPIIRNIHNMSIFLDKLKIGEAKDTKDLLMFIFCFTKKMSDNECYPDDFKNYDESEWRILLMEDNERHQPKVKLYNGDNPPAKITFDPNDLKIIIFPDHKTRQMAFNDSYVVSWLGKNIPIMATIEECLYF